MRFHPLTPGEHVKAIGIGAIVAILLSAVMVPAFMLGISPLPKPLGLAFAETLLLEEQPAQDQQQAEQAGRQRPAQQAQQGQQQQPAGQAPQQAGRGGGKGLPLPVGLAFHVAYVTFWSWVYVVLFRDRLTLLNALLLAGFLWVLVPAVFFPVVGWGFLGLEVSPKLIPASLVPHLLFAIFLWILCRIGFRTGATSGRVRTA